MNANFKSLISIEAALEQTRLAEADALVAETDNLPELNDVCADNLKTLQLSIRFGRPRHLRHRTSCSHLGR